VFPQVLINVEVSDKPDIEIVPEIKDAIASVERRLDNEGRVLVRYSGTEPLCRVMVEGPLIDKTRIYCQELADVVKKNIGKRKEESG
ncbi:MAG: phosphoglucosamine mutase, partial [Desulfobacterales bacterium]|nr:phosphoglucosamine mutase [Desulfobacterales bacterium]